MESQFQNQIQPYQTLYFLPDVPAVSGNHPSETPPAAQDCEMVLHTKNLPFHICSEKTVLILLFPFSIEGSDPRYRILPDCQTTVKIRYFASD